METFFLLTIRYQDDSFIILEIIASILGLCCFDIFIWRKAVDKVWIQRFWIISVCWSSLCRRQLSWEHHCLWLPQPQRQGLHHGRQIPLLLWLQWRGQWAVQWSYWSCCWCPRQYNCGRLGQLQSPGVWPVWLISNICKHQWLQDLWTTGRIFNYNWSAFYNTCDFIDHLCQIILN